MDSVFSLLGGLGLFIYGMKRMADGLQKAAGKKLKQLLSLLTTNRIAGLLVGTGVTSIIQSSSATTVMVVGFVNAGLMTITQSIGVIMGANIGTTITAQLIAFKLSHYALHAVAIGAVLYLFGRTKRTNQIGQIILGFGILFLGLTIMKDTMRPLRDSQMFIDAMKKFGQYPILGVLIGTGVTIMVQSSSASLGILMSLLSVGAINYYAAVPILLGDNIGTTITAVLSSIGANRNAKRSAAAHVIFNVIGTAVFLTALYLIPDLPKFLEGFFTQVSNFFGQDISPSRLLANTHSAFNIVNALIWLPFVGVLARIVKWVVPGEDQEIERGLKYIDERMLETPGVAVDQVNKEIKRMLEICFDMVKEAEAAFVEKDEKLLKSIRKKEEIVNEIEEELLVFLTRIPQEKLTDEDVEMIDRYFIIIDAVESVGDDADELAELIEESIDMKAHFSDEARESILGVFKTVIGLAKKTDQLLENKELTVAKELLEAEKEIDKLQAQYKDQHMKRLNEGSCIPVIGIVYLEMLESLEHISDQTATIANSFYGEVW